jgi:hypothetical protein
LIVTGLMPLVTVTGGHFINRRIDKGLLFLSLLLLLAIGIVAGPLLVAMVLGPKSFVVEPPTMFRSGVWMAAGLGTLAVVSMYTAVLDGRRADQQVPLSVVGKVGGLLGTLLGLLITGTLAANSLNLMALGSEYGGRAGDEQAGEGEATSDAFGAYFARHWFDESVVYGGEWKGKWELEPMPAGDAFLTGQIWFGAAPAPGVELMAVIDERYRSEPLVSLQRRKERVEGLWHAVTGDCAAAHARFARLRAETGETCVPALYEQLCPPQSAPAEGD